MPHPMESGLDYRQDVFRSGEIDTAVWGELDIPDSVEWLKELRRKEQAQRLARWGGIG